MITLNTQTPRRALAAAALVGVLSAGAATAQATEQQTAAGWATNTMSMMDGVKYVMPQGETALGAGLLRDDTNSGYRANKHGGGFDVWAGFGGSLYGGDAEGGNVQLTVGAGYNFAQGTIGAFVTQSDALIFTPLTSVSSETTSFGAYFQYNFANAWGLNGMAFTGESEIFVPGGNNTESQSGAEIELTRAYTIAGLETTSFVSASYAQGTLPAEGITPLPSRSVDTVSASLGSHISFGNMNGLSPYALVAVDYNAASTGAGVSIDHVAPRLGTGVTFDGKYVDFNMHLETSTTFDGVRKSTIGIGLNADF